MARVYGDSYVAAAAAAPTVGAAGGCYYNTTNKQLYLSDGAAWNLPTPVHQVLSGSLGGDVALPAATLTTVLTTASLGVGTWLLTAAVTVLIAGTGGNLDATCAVGTATATFTGAQSQSQRLVASTPGPVTFSTVVVVTVAGTILVRIKSINAATAKALTITDSYANASGYTALRIA
jgi:hypothetical protein